MSGRHQVAGLVPQAGAMVLLDEVIEHDAERIVCRATSHRDPAHPLARAGMLPAWAGIEYAAQAMAAHFALASNVSGAATVGLLGGLRDVVCTVVRLDDVAGALRIEARRLSHDPAGSIYAFTLTAESDGRLLMRGRATVVQRTTDRA
jgi:predicted hotdog family 3-hydroxylacyl-ACP dehydratase